MTVYTAPPTQSHLVLNFGDTLNVEVNGLAYNTVINQGAVLNVGPGGTAIATTINVGGLEIVTNGGTDKTVIFAGSNSLLDLAKPTGLTGTIIDWHVGDIIDFLHTAVTSVREDSAHTTLTVTYGTNQTAIYMLAGQQADTQFRLQSDGNGGTDRRIGAPNSSESCCAATTFERLEKEPRCRQSVAQNASTLELLKGGLWKPRLMPAW